MANNHNKSRIFLKNNFISKNNLISLLFIFITLFWMNCKPKSVSEIQIPLKTGKVLFNQWNDIFDKGEIVHFTFDDPDQEIFTIGDMLISSTGDYFILDGKASKILRFDATAKFKQYIGNYGEGPGEYTLFGCPYIDNNNNFYIYDIGKRRIIKYRFPDYIFEEQFRIPTSIQDLILDDNGNFIVYTVSEPNILYKINRKGEVIKKSFRINQLKFRIFCSRFQLGRFSNVKSEAFLFTYPEEYKIYLFDYQLNLKKVFYVESTSRYFPGKAVFPVTLSPSKFTPKHSRWWSQSLRPAMVLNLSNRLIVKQLIEYTNLSGKFYANIHDLDGKTYALGLEVPFEGIIRYAKDGYIYVVEDSKFDENKNVIPLKLHRFKVKDKFKQ